VVWTSVAVAVARRHVLVAIVEEREISHADLRFTTLHCSVLAAALPLSTFPLEYLANAFCYYFCVFLHTLYIEPHLNCDLWFYLILLRYNSHPWCFPF